MANNYGYPIISRLDPFKVRPQDIQCPTCKSIGTFCLDMLDLIEESTLPRGIFHEKRIAEANKEV